MKKNIDEVLKRALSPAYEPDSALNEQIIGRVKEMENMKKERKNKGRLPMAAAIAAAVFVMGSGTAFAAWKYLTPAEVAQNSEEEKLAEAFLSEDAVVINQQQTIGDYTVTLLGTTSGKNLAEYVSDDSIENNRTYVVAAIEKTDGSSMPVAGEESFFASPLIEGLDPEFYNVYTLEGMASRFVQDGVEYQVVSTDNIEVFADRDIYFCVNTGWSYDAEGYVRDEATGKITRNEAYAGLNALFDLPIDPAKADPEATKAVIEKADSLPGLDKTYRKFAESLTAENLDVYLEKLEVTEQTLIPDENGCFQWEYDFEGNIIGGQFYVNEVFPDSKCNVPVCLGYMTEIDAYEFLIDVVVLNEDGTITYSMYTLKTPQ